MLELGAFAPGWRPGRALFPKPRGRTLRGVPVAKWTRRRFPEPKIVGSNPIWDVVLAGPKLFCSGIINSKNKKAIPGGTRTPNLLIRSQTPCPIGPQGLALAPACRLLKGFRGVGKKIF